MNQIFITGTDTGVGKTHVATTLLRQLNNQGFKTFAIKPIASGAIVNSEGIWVNDDALNLQKSASLMRPYSLVNPFVFKEPIAPHLAAQKEDIQLSLKSVVKSLTASFQPEADFTLIEGVGGWSVPLNDYELVSDIVRALQIPTVLVVGIKLGCLNHAILTQQSIFASDVPFVGWIANCIDPDTLAVEEIIDTLEKWLRVPLLGKIPHGIEYPICATDLNLEPFTQNKF